MPDLPALPPYELGFAGTETRRQLVDSVLRGEKTATASLRAMYQPFTTDPLPRAGGRFLLVGYSDEPCGTVEVTRVEVVPLDSVHLQFAIDEGEGYTSAEDWRAAGLQYWAAYRHEVTGSTLVVCEWFRLVEQYPGRMAVETRPEIRDRASQQPPCVTRAQVIARSN